MNGIISYGTYLPKNRLHVFEIAAVWKKDAASINSSLGVLEKTVASYDEDAVTMGFEAAKEALDKSALSPKKISSLFVGSESHPYAVNPTSTIIGEFLDINKYYFASDLEFACKAATTGLIITSSLVAAKKIDYGLVIGTDCAQAKPHDALEYTASSAAAAFILGSKNNEVICEIEDYCSFSSDTPDFWRRDGVSYPSHGGRFTGEPAYFTHVLNAAKNLLTKTKSQPKDFTYCVFHMPNRKFPQDAAKRLGFNPSQLLPSLTVEQVGNPYSASSLLGLINVLDMAKPNSKIFFVSYGSGAGADALMLKTTTNLPKYRKNKKTLKEQIADKKHMTYLDYLKARKVI